MAKKKTATLEVKDLATLKGMDRSELQSELHSARRELYVLTMKKELGELKQTHKMRAARKYIAQVSTFLTSSL